MKMFTLKSFAVHSFTAALILSGMPLLSGCGSEEPAAKPAPAAKAGGESKAAEVAKETAKEIVAIKDALSLVPESADIALNLPAVNAVLADVIPFAKGIAGDSVDIDAELSRIVADAAADLKVDGATTFNDIAVAKGISFDEGVAVFAEFSPTLASAKANMPADAGAAKAASSEEDADNAEHPDAVKGDDADEAGDVDADDSAEDEDADEDEGMEFGFEADDLALPTIALVAGVTDAAKVEAFLQGIAKDELGLGDATEEEANGVKIKTYSDGHSYFIAGGKVAISNNVAFLKEVAGRISNPAVLRYGTAECPKTNENEAALLIFGGNIKNDVQGVLPTLKLDPGMDAIIQYQMQMIEAAFGGDSGNDPIVTTLAWDDTMIELKNRVDMKTHPGLMTTSGKAGELKLAQLLPVGTQALVSLRFNDELKKQIKEVYLPMIADATGNDGIKGMGPQVIDQIGDELTVGITGAENDFPQLYLMISLAQAEATKSLLQMFVPQMEDAEHNGVMISTIAAPVPVPLSICYAGNIVIISNGVEGMKSIIDHTVANTKSEFFTKLSPAIDPAVPRYSGIILNTDLVTSILPLLALSGGVPQEAEDVIGPLTQTLQEVRILSEMNGDWSETTVSLYLKAPAVTDSATAAPVN